MLCDEGFKKELRKGDIWISYMVLSLAWLQVYNCPVISFKRSKKNGNIFSFGSATWLVYQFKVNLGIELMTYSPMESYIPLRAIINISLFFFAAWQCSPTKMAGSIRPYCWRKDQTKATEFWSTRPRIAM